MNYFAHQTAARRYARSRPYFHPQVVGDITRFLKIEAPVAWALDVACGTGQSAAALRTIASQVVGADRSPDMLAQAPRNDDRLQYVCASAEALPFAPGVFDVVTVALAFHWFDRTRFLREAGRVLRPLGWLVIYNNGFGGEMRENPAFAAWSQNVYLARYPSPPRNAEPLSDEEAARLGFRFVGRERYTNDVSFSPGELAAYLCTQSNVIAAAEQGGEDGAAVQQWLIESLTPLFPATARATFSFTGTIWYLQNSQNDSKVAGREAG